MIHIKWIKYLIIFLLFLFNSTSFAQNNIQIDSLNLEFKAAKHDTTRIKILTDIAFEYKTINPDTCITLSQKALEMSEKIYFDKGIATSMNRMGMGYYLKGNYSVALACIQQSLLYYDKISDKKGLGSSLNTLGIIYHNQNNYALALEFYEKGLKVSEEIGNKHVISGILNNLGIVYGLQGNYPLALEYYQKSLDIQEEIGNKEVISISLNNLGSIYISQGNYSRAMEYCQRSLKLNEEIGSKIGIAESLINIGNIYKEQGNYTLALENHQKSLKIHEETGQKRNIGENLSNIGDIYRQQGNYPLALEYYQKCLKIREEIGEKEGIAYTLNGLSNIAQQQKDFDKSIAYAQRSLQIAQQIKTPLEIRNASKTLFESYKLKGDYAKALEFLEQYKQINDSLFSLSKSRAISNIETKVELERKDKEIAIAKKNEEVIRKDTEIQRIEVERQKSVNLILAKEQEAERLAYLALQEKNQRKQDSLRAEAQKIQLEADNLKITQLKLNAERKTREVELLKEREAKELLQYINYLVIAGLFSLFILLFFIYRSRQILQKANQRIQSANEEVKNVNEVLRITLETVQFQKDQILASINYAKRIQDAILPLPSTFDALLPDHFVILKACDIVSGDFYYLREIDKKIILAAVDCTGHGVPGAFMSFIGYLGLNVLTVIMKITAANEILRQLHIGIRQILRQKETKTNDGMDMALVVLDREKRTLAFAGAKNPLIYIQNGELHQIKGDVFGIGGDQLEIERNFTLHEIDLSQSTTFYLFSDGYQDQFGGERSKKFMSKRFRELLFEIQSRSMHEQKVILERTIKDWMQEGNQKQTDDILVIGVRV